MKEMKEVLSEFCGMQESLTERANIVSVYVHNWPFMWSVELNTTQFEGNKIFSSDRLEWKNFREIHNDEDEAENEERVLEFMRRNAL